MNFSKLHKGYLVMIIFSTTLLHSFAQTPEFKNPVDYNDYIIGEQLKIGQKLQEFSKTIESRSKSKMNLALAAVKAQIVESLERIRAIGSYEDNSEFRNAAILLFEFYNVISNNQYEEVIEIVAKEKYSNVDQERIKNLMGNMSKQEASHDKKFATAQKNFAEQFDISITENE